MKYFNKIVQLLKRTPANVRKTVTIPFSPTCNSDTSVTYVNQERRLFPASKMNNYCSTACTTVSWLVLSPTQPCIPPDWTVPATLNTIKKE
jgi:hypothetical protein